MVPRPSAFQGKCVRLYQAMPVEMYVHAPLSLLLAPRLPLEFSEFPMSYLLALEHPSGKTAGAAPPETGRS